MVETPKTIDAVAALVIPIAASPTLQVEDSGTSQETHGR